MEVSTLITLVHLAQGLPNPTRQQIQQGITDYTNSIIQREWKTMQSNQEDPTTWQLLNQVETVYLHFQPHSVTENDIYMESLKRLSDVRNYRRMRIFQVTRPKPFEDALRKFPMIEKAQAQASQHSIGSSPVLNS